MFLSRSLSPQRPRPRKSILSRTLSLHVSTARPPPRRPVAPSSRPQFPQVAIQRASIPLAPLLLLPIRFKPCSTSSQTQPTPAQLISPRFLVLLLRQVLPICLHSV